MSVSVVIPSYNSVDTITRTLESLLKQEKGSPVEIIVVDSSDDGSTPQALEDIRRKARDSATEIRIIRVDRKTMPAIARNVGANHARGHLLAFIDADAYAAPDWIDRIRAARAQDLRVGGGSVRLPPEQRWRMIALAQYFLQFNEFLDRGPRRVKSFVASVNLFCDKELFDALGGFPEIRASEDVSFGFRARQQAPVWFDPAICVHHVFRENLGAYLRNQHMLGTYTLIFLRQTGPRALYGGIRPALLLPAFVLLKCSRIVFRVLATFDLAKIAGFLYSLALFVPGLTYWCIGFFQACLTTQHRPR
jgi:glycosyltransferase involved in cell wall biosynthesis